MLQWLLDFISTFFSTLWTIIMLALDGAILLIKLLFFTMYDGILIVIHGFMAAIDFSEVAFNYGAKYSHLPPQLIYLCSAVDLPQMFAYITGAIIIRMTVNLIPAAFTRI